MRRRRTAAICRLRSTYVVCTNSKIPYWQEVGAGLVQAAKELKVQAELVGPDTYDPNAQRDHFRRTVAKKPAGILVSPGNPELLKPEIDSAIAAGIPGHHHRFRRASKPAALLCRDE